MTTRTFGDLTFWHHLQPIRIAGGWDPGWRPTDGAFDHNIGRADTYWGEVLQKAKVAYGDPHMRYNTDDTSQDRYLVFGDGTRVPADGSLAYHDSSTKTTYLLNTDGSVSPLNGAGRAGDPIVPAGLRRGADGALAPIDAAGHQIAPLVGQAPPAPYGYHDDHGVLTPKNAAGDYYTLGANGQRRFFDQNGAPIDEDRFTKDAAGQPNPPAGVPLPTDEQQSGHAADAVQKLQGELRGRYDKLGQAEEQLSEVMLNAHATTVDGRARLDAIQRDIIAAVNNPSMSLDTPAGQQAYLKFLRSKTAAIGEVVASGSLTAADQAKVATALAGLYGNDFDGGPRPATPNPAPNPAPSPAAADPPAPAPQGADPGLPMGASEADLGPLPAMPDPSLSDVLGSPLGGLGANPLTSMLPGALGGLGGLGGGMGGGDPFGLSGLGGAASPLAGLASPGDQPRPDDADADRSDDRDNAEKDQGSPPHTDPPQPSGASTPPDPAPGAPQPNGEPGQGAPPGALGGPVGGSPTVALPDGSTANAKTPALARAVTSYLGGTPVDAAYRENGIALPPPGTPVTDPADPAELSCGFLGMYRDHYVVAASAVKAIQDGQIVPLSAVTSSPDFLGWIDPTTLTASRTPTPVGAGAGGGTG